jgi:hypothetical protein
MKHQSSLSDLEAFAKKRIAAEFGEEASRCG